MHTNYHEDERDYPSVPLKNLSGITVVPTAQAVYDALDRIDLHGIETYFPSESEDEDDR